MPKIVVIEDDKLIQREYRMDFAELEAPDVMFYSNKAEALNAIRGQRFDGAIIDLNLSNDTGHGEGLEILDYIQRCKEETVCFVVTATSVPSDLNKAWKYGSTDVIVKSEETFYKIVDRIIRKSSDARKVFLRDTSALVSALASPEKLTFWESSFYPYAGGVFESGRRGVLELLRDYAPLLRPKNSLYSFQRNEPRSFLSGSFWSKAAGSAIYVEIGDPASVDARGGSLGEHLISRRRIDKSVDVAVFRDARDREAFVEFWHEKSTA